MQKSGNSLCKSENPLYKKIPFEKKITFTAKSQTKSGIYELLHHQNNLVLDKMIENKDYQ